MKARPILFRGDMVRALLDGRKTQTRRVVKRQPPSWARAATRLSSALNTALWFFVEGRGKYGDRCTKPGVKCPYGQPGDLLWVRETWGETVGRSDRWPAGTTMYKADHGVTHGGIEYDLAKWRPSIHMPRWASRLTLRITEARVERLRDISEGDAIAEGVDAVSMAAVPRQATWSRRQDFAQLWDRLNGDSKEFIGWADNPWVWVVGFEVIRANVDEVLAP